jgi:hypothetical protein
MLTIFWEQKMNLIHKYNDVGKIWKYLVDT